MKLKISNNKKSYLTILLILSSLFALFWSLPLFTSLEYNSLCINDGVHQYIPFLTELYNKLKEGESLFYSFNGGLGFNFYATICYYLLSPFNIIIIFFKKEYIYIAVQIIIMLKIISIGMSMNYYLLHRFKLKRYNISIILSIVYALSGYFLGYMYNFMWLDSILCLPFILRGLETISSKKGKIQYIIALSLCMITNFYISFMICIFLILYFFTLNFKNKKDFLFKGLNFGCSSIISAFISGIVLIPMLLNIISMNSSRTTIPDLYLFNSFFEIINSHLPFNNIITLSRMESSVNLYCTLGVVLLTLLFLFNKNIENNRKIKMIALLLFIFLSFNISLFNFIMHGFYSQRSIPNRFGFLYTFIIIVISYESLSNIKAIEKKQIIMSFSIMFIALIICYLNTSFDSFFIEKDWFKIIVYIYSTLIILLYSYLILIKKENLILILLFIEILIGTIDFQTTTLGDSYQLQKYYETAIDTTSKNNSFRKELLSSDITNAPTLYSINGITSFNSIINKETASFLGKLGFASGENYYRYLGHTPLTDSMFGIKYVYSKYNEDLPFNFKYLNTTNGISVFENKYFLPLGYSIDLKPLNENFSNKLENLNNLTTQYGKLFDGISIETNYDSNNCNIEMEDNSNFIISSKNNNSEVSFTFEPIEAGNVYIYTRIITDCNLLIEVNDKIITSNNYSGYISYLGNISKNDEIKITYNINEKIDKEELCIFMGSFNENVFMNFYNEMLENSVENIDIKNNKISGSFNSYSSKKLIFTLPYDKGWKCFVNQKQVEIKENNGLISFYIEKGKSDIVLTYIPQGFTIGMYCSIIGLFLFYIYIYISKLKSLKK